MSDDKDIVAQSRHIICFTTKIALYIPTTAFSPKLHSKRDHTKPHLVWHDTLAPTNVPMAQLTYHPTRHSKHAYPGNFEAFFLARSIGHASALTLFRGFSQGHKALQG